MKSVEVSCSDFGFEKDFEANFMRQDSIILNLQRACEQSIVLANHLIRIRKLGVPQSSVNSFEILQESGFIGKDIADKLGRMVGFRNVAVHNYTQLNLAIVKNIITKGISDFRNFIKIALQAV